METLKNPQIILTAHYAQSPLPKFRIQKKKMEEYILRAIHVLREKIFHQKVQISLIFVDEKKIQEFNRIYRHKNTPTDVLSFKIYEEKSPEKIPLFGEIYICLAIAQEQAEHKKYSLEKQVNTLFVHGLLHLFGYDHENEDDFADMKSAENFVLKSSNSLLEHWE